MIKPGTLRLSRGFSLIELMLAMLIGLIIIGGVMSLYVSTRNTQRSSEDQLNMISNANFVIETISDDLRQAGFWGDAAATNLVSCRTGDPKCTGADIVPAAAGDCAPGWYADLTNPVIATDNTTVFSGIDYAGTCITQSYRAGTDLIGVHYGNSATIADNLLVAHTVYLRSNYKAAGILVPTVSGINAIPLTGSYDNFYAWDPNIAKNANITTNRLLEVHLYYISNDTVAGDGIPSLHRVELTSDGTQPVMADNMLLSGVADLQIQFGVPVPNTNPTTYTYVNPGNVPVNSTTGLTNWGQIQSAKIWVLIRSDRADADLAGQSQTFTLANHGPITYNDGHRYYMMTSVVELRNNK